MFWFRKSFSPLASVSEPEDLLWRSEYFLALLFAAHCWLRVTMRSDEKLDSATAVDASATAWWASSAPTTAGELLLTGLQLSGEKERGKNFLSFYGTCNYTFQFLLGLRNFCMKSTENMKFEILKGYVNVYHPNIQLDSNNDIMTIKDAATCWKPRWFE